MASTDFTIKLDDSDRELIRRLTDAIEGARPPRSNSVQPLVGPPDVNQGEPAALARPATIAKVVTIVEEAIMQIRFVCIGKKSRLAFDEIAESLVQQIEDLDQGPIAKPLSKPKSPNQCPPHYYR